MLLTRLKFSFFSFSFKILFLGKRFSEIFILVIWLLLVKFLFHFLLLQVEYECINEKKRQKKKSYKNSGVISVKHCEVSCP